MYNLYRVEGVWYIDLAILYGFNDNNVIDEKKGTFPIGINDMRSSLSLYKTFNLVKTLEGRKHLTIRVYEELIKNTINNKGVPQYIAKSDIEYGQCDYDFFLYCGKSKIEKNFSNPFEGQVRNAYVRLDTGSSYRVPYSVKLYYHWLRGDDIEYNDLNKTAMHVNDVEQQRRGWILGMLPGLYWYCSALMCDCEDSDMCHTKILRLLLEEDDTYHIQPTTTFLRNELEQLNSSAFGKQEWIYTWEFIKYEKSVKNSIYGITCHYPENLYQSMKIDTRGKDKRRIEIAHAKSPDESKQLACGKYKLNWRNDWEEKKLDAMKFVISQQFYLGSFALLKLIMTGRMYLICNHSEFANNELGDILMDERCNWFDKLEQLSHNKKEIIL